MALLVPYDVAKGMTVVAVEVGVDVAPVRLRGVAVSVAAAAGNVLGTEVAIGTPLSLFGPCKSREGTLAAVTSVVAVVVAGGGADVDGNDDVDVVVDSSGSTGKGVGFGAVAATVVVGGFSVTSFVIVDVDCCELLLFPNEN